MKPLVAVRRIMEKSNEVNFGRAATSGTSTLEKRFQ